MQIHILIHMKNANFSAPRKKKPQADIPHSDQPLALILAPEVSRNVTTHQPSKDTEQYTDEFQNATRVAYENTDIIKIDELIQKVKYMCITGAQQDAKDPILNEILKISSTIDEKYAIIDVSGLIEANKVCVLATSIV